MSKKLDIRYVAGTEQYPHAKAQTARSIENLSYDFNQRAWSNEKGIVSYWNNTGSKPTADVTSIFYWSRRGGKAESTLFELDTGQNEVSLCKTAPYEDVGYVVLQQGRTKPRPQDPGTNYIPYGNFCFVLNGEDNPLKLVSYFPEVGPFEFGFPTRPSQPMVLDSGDGGAAGYILFSPSGSGCPSLSGPGITYAEATNAGGAKITLPNEASLGFGDQSSGDDLSGSINAYRYKVSFVSNTYSESPLSLGSPTVSFKNGADAFNDSTALNGDKSKYGAVISNIPTGPMGTFKRRLYRTKNLGDGTIDPNLAVYYFLDEIPNNFQTTYTDLIPDSQLGSEAPSDLESFMLPPNLKYGATFANRLVLGGGVSYPTRLFYSNANRPEEFGLDKFVEVGNRVGGVITGLVPFNNLLVIFREHSIDALVPTNNADFPFYVTPIFTGAGTVATKTAVVVPGVGLVFATAEGVYSFQGNFSGGGQANIQRISDAIGEDYERVSSYSLARACAVYDNRFSEYVLSVPADGSAVNSLVFCYNAALVSWSIRHSLPASCFTNSREGYVLFGSNASSLGIADVPSIGVICNTNQNMADTLEKPAGTWTSAWLDFGDPDSTKNIRTVSIDAYTTGEHLYTMNSAIEWDYEYINTAYSSPSVADYKAQAVIGQVEFDQNFKWENRRIAKMRFDLELPEARWFRFKLSSTEPLLLIGYSVEFDEGGETRAWSAVFNTPPFNNGNRNVDPSKLPI